MESSKPPDLLDVGVEDDGSTVIISLFVGFSVEAPGAATASTSGSSVRGDATYGFHIEVL